MRIAADEWDGDEMYFVWDELKGQFPEMRFEKCLTVQDLSPCKNNFQFVEISKV